MLMTVFYAGADACADEIYLKNGDRITGEITGEAPHSISVNTGAMGTVTINRGLIQRIARPAAEEAIKPKEDAREPVWQKEISAGYNKTTGNTRDGRLSLSLFINRNVRHVDEITLKGNFYYYSVNRKMEAQKSYAMGRYAFSFGRDRNWYNFYRLEADHDRFANIDYRIIPSAGFGYWFFDLPDIKALAETAVGLEHTDFRDEDRDKNEAVLIPRVFFEKGLFKNSRIRENLLLYPALNDFNEYRLRSESVFEVSLDKRFLLRLSLIDDYNSSPPKDTKKNDLRLISSLAYSF